MKIKEILYSLWLFVKKTGLLLKKVLFPFKREGREFLFKKWWFRLVIVLYLIALIVSPFYIFISYTKSETDWCYNSLYLYYDDTAEFNRQLSNCSNIARQAWQQAIPISIFGTLIAHYLIQLVFFKVVIDFIVGKNHLEKSEEEIQKSKHALKKLTLPLTIVLASLIIGGFVYAAQVNKQKSIEKQQQLDLQAKAEQDKVKAEQDKKEYVAKRKNDCLSIYKTESDKWNNVRGYRYDEEADACKIRYKEPNPKSDEKCEEMYKGLTGFSFIYDKLLCKDGEFENSF